MSMTKTNWSKLSAVGCFGLLVAASACGQSQSGALSSGDSPAYAAVEAALENPVLKCEQDNATCVGAAKDPMAALACNDTLRMCLSGAATQGEKAATDLEQCREKATECVVKAGPTGAMTCRGDYEKCVAAVTGEPTQPTQPSEPTAGAAAPGLPRLPLAGRSAPRLPVGGGSAFPTLPGTPGGAFPRFPGAGGGPSFPQFPQAGRMGLPDPRGGTDAAKCFVTLRECVRTPGKDPNQCATEARACLGGMAPGNGGKGGAGGST